MRRIRANIKVNPALLVMAILLALSMVATIVLAAFSANKGGAVVLSFGDGLTMKLTPVGTSGRIQITAANENQTTFSYQPMNGLTNYVTLDGIMAEINQDAFIAFKIELKEATSSEVAPLGAWEIRNSTDAWFTPSETAPLNRWMASFSSTGTGFSPQLYGSTTNAIYCASSTILSHSSQIKLFDYMRVRGYPDMSYVTDLQERSFKFYITITARTDQVPQI